MIGYPFDAGAVHESATDCEPTCVIVGAAAASGIQAKIAALTAYEPRPADVLAATRINNFDPSRATLVIVSDVALAPGVATCTHVEPVVLVSTEYPVTARLFAPTVGAIQEITIELFEFLMAESEVGASGVVTGMALTLADVLPQPLLL